MFIFFTQTYLCFKISLKNSVFVSFFIFPLHFSSYSDLSLPSSCSSPSSSSSPLCRVAVLVAGDNPCHGGWLGIRTSSLFTAGRMIQRLVAPAPAAAALCWISNMFEWDKRDGLAHRTPPPNPYTAVKWAGPAAPHLDPCWLSPTLRPHPPQHTGSVYSSPACTHTPLNSDFILKSNLSSHPCSAEHKVLCLWVLVTFRFLFSP